MAILSAVGEKKRKVAIFCKIGVLEEGRKRKASGSTLT